MRQVSAGSIFRVDFRGVLLHSSPVPSFRPTKTLLLGFFLGVLLSAAPVLWVLTEPQPEFHLPSPPPRLSFLPDLTGQETSFARLLRNTFGQRVIPVDLAEKPHAVIIFAVQAAAEECRSHFSGPGSPLAELSRINEASRHFEDHLHALLDAHPDLSCEIPPNAAGDRQRSGYPDLRIVHLPSGTVAYLDPKLFEASSADSSFRTFYYEPRRETGKVTDDALHLLLGFAHDGKDRAWTFTHCHLVDLSRLDVTLKAEFSASNRDLYQPDLLIAGP